MRKADYAAEPLKGAEFIMALTISRLCQGIAPSVTLKINARAAELRESGQDIIALGAGEPDFDTPAFIREAAKRAIDEEETRYTAAAGTPRLRQAVCDFLLREKELSYSASQVLICNGAKQALVNALAAMLDPGDEVILPAPCWVSYPEMIGMAGGKAVWVYADEGEGFIPPIERIRAAVTERTKAIILNSPSNPTGAVWSREQLLAVGELAVEKDFYIISDEIYDKLLYDGAEATSVPSLSPAIYARTVLINGWSKAYAMTGWRLGYAAGPKRLIAAMSAYQSHATGNPNSIAQAAGLAALTGDQSCVSQMAAAFARRRELALGLIARMPQVSCFVPRGAFYIMLNVKNLIGKQYGGREIQSDGDVAELLLEYAQVAVVPGGPFGAPGYCRISYAAADNRLAEALRRIKLFLYNLETAQAMEA